MTHFSHIQKTHLQHVEELPDEFLAHYADFLEDMGDLREDLVLKTSLPINSRSSFTSCLSKDAGS